MRILITSAPFHPSLGGIETATNLQASGLIERGYDVTVVTPTPGDCGGYPYKVVRNAKPVAFLRLVRDSDLMWQGHVSLRLLWCAALACSPVTSLSAAYLRDAAKSPGPVIPNSYDERTFRALPDVPRDRDVVYLGRLKAFKGPDLVVDALARLAAANKRLSATMIGMGPQVDELKEQAARAGIAAQVKFPGPLQGDALVRAINRHRIMVVPSRWEEPFGLVALEGMARGGGVENSGGLPEVAGPCGPVVPKDDPAALAAKLDRLVSHPEIVAQYRRAVPQHLAKFRTTPLLDACKAAIREAIANSRYAPASRQATNPSLQRH